MTANLVTNNINCIVGPEVRRLHPTQKIKLVSVEEVLRFSNCFACTPTNEINLYSDDLIIISFSVGASDGATEATSTSPEARTCAVSPNGRLIRDCDLLCGLIEINDNATT